MRSCRVIIKMSLIAFNFPSSFSFSFFLILRAHLEATFLTILQLDPIFFLFSFFSFVARAMPKTVEKLQTIKLPRLSLLRSICVAAADWLKH